MLVTYVPTTRTEMIGACPWTHHEDGKCLSGTSHSHNPGLLPCRRLCKSRFVTGRKRSKSASPVARDMTVIAASLRSQSAVEANGSGVFTTAIVNALKGAAADPIGWVTAPSIYAYVERRFGAFDQRPVYKSYATGVRVVRKCAPLIERFKLRRLVELFPAKTTSIRWILSTSPRTKMEKSMSR